MHELAKPIIAALPGPAAGAGLSIALAADLRVMLTTLSLPLPLQHRTIRRLWNQLVFDAINRSVTSSRINANSQTNYSAGLS
ncbi:MAG: hypothetical protein CM1200mP24_00460 [Gammaproteobacteria bacterium]|nr:MAG: hypothetical protein CM1200mP24_00460 [Gammaproteobacteria bacterium]